MDCVQDLVRVTSYNTTRTKVSGTLKVIRSLNKVYTSILPVLNLPIKKSNDGQLKLYLVTGLK